MAFSVNNVVIGGNVCKDIELRTIPSGTSVCELSLAINDRVKQGGEWKEKSSFVEVVLWGRTAEIAAEYLSKGSPCLIIGRIDQQTWEKDGKRHSKLKVIGEKMQLLGGKSGQKSKPQRDDDYDEPATSPDDSSLPF